MAQVQKPITDYSLRNRAKKAQASKVFYNVSMHSSSPGIKLKGAQAYLTKPQHRNYVYLLDFYIVGNPVDLKNSLRVIDQRLTNTTDQQLNQVIADFGVTLQNYNSNNAKLVQAMQVEEAAASSRKASKPPLTADQKYVQIQVSLNQIDEFMRLSEENKGKVMKADSSGVVVSVGRKTKGGVTLAEQVQAAVAKTQKEGVQYVVKVNGLVVHDASTGKILKKNMPIVKYTDRSRIRTIPGTYIASDNPQKFAMAISLLGLPNAQQLINQFSSVSTAGLASPSLGFAGQFIGQPVVSTPVTQFTQLRSVVPTFNSPIPTQQFAAPVLQRSVLPTAFPLPSLSPVSTLLPPPTLSPVRTSVLPTGLPLPQFSPSRMTSLPPPSLSPSLRSNLPLPQLSPSRRLPAPTGSPTVVRSSPTRISPRSVAMPALASPARSF